MDLPDGRVRSVRQIVNLVPADGTVVRLWVRPEAERKALNGATVVARGRLLAASGQASSAAMPGDAPSLVEIERIERA